MGVIVNVDVNVGSEARFTAIATPKINFYHLEKANFARVIHPTTYKKCRIHRGYGIFETMAKGEALITSSYVQDYRMES